MKLWIDYWTWLIERDFPKKYVDDKQFKTTVLHYFIKRIIAFVKEMGFYDSLLMLSRIVGVCLIYV